MAASTALTGPDRVGTGWSPAATLPTGLHSMHVLLIAISKTAGAPVLAGMPLPPDMLEQLLPFPSFVRDDWTSTARDVAVLRWTQAGSGAGLKHQPGYWGTDAAGMSALAGWALDPASPGAPPEEVAAALARGSGGIEGKYLFVHADHEGRGGIRRTRAGTMPLFASSSPAAWFLSNRASIAAAAAQGSRRLEPDLAFHAEMVGAGWALGRRTAFAGTEAVPAAARVTFAPGRLHITLPAEDDWHDPRITEALTRSPKAAWDEIFEQLCSFNRALGDLVPEGGARLHLSGGMDSRLVLGILQASSSANMLESVTVSGAPFLPDAAVARCLAEHYGGRVQARLPTLSLGRIGDQLGQHLFHTDAGISPWDLSWTSGRSPAGAAIYGHEVATKEAGGPADLAAFTAWGETYFHGFDVLKVLRPERTAAIRRGFEHWVDAAARHTTPSNLPARLRMESRGERWFAVIDSFEATRAMTVSPLLTDFVTRHQYSAGAGLRAACRFHFEMMMRSDPWLVAGAPLAGKEWPKELAPTLQERGVTPPPPVPDLAAAPSLRLSDLAFEAHRERLFDWLLAEPGHDIFSIIDPGALAELRSQPVAGRRRMALWNLVQAKLAIDTADWGELAPWRASIPEALLRMGLPLVGPNGVAEIDARELERLREQEKLAGIYGDVIARLLAPGAG